MTNEKLARVDAIEQALKSFLGDYDIHARHQPAIGWLCSELREAWADVKDWKSVAKAEHDNGEKLREDLKKVHVCKLMPECSKEQVENIRLRSEAESLHLELAEKTGALAFISSAVWSIEDPPIHVVREFKKKANEVLAKWDRTGREDTALVAMAEEAKDEPERVFEVIQDCGGGGGGVYYDPTEKEEPKRRVTLYEDSFLKMEEELEDYREALYDIQVGMSAGSPQTKAQLILEKWDRTRKGE